MNTYIVRHRVVKKEGSTGWMGLVVANSARDLFWILDQAGNPWDFIFRKLQPREPAMVLVPFEVKRADWDEEGEEIEGVRLYMGALENHRYETDELFGELIEAEDGWRSFRQCRKGYGPSYDSNKAKSPWRE